MSETALELVLDMLRLVFGSSIIAGIFLIAAALVVFCLFLVASIGLAYIAAWLWAGYESDFDDGDDEKFAFDEDQVIDAVGLVFTNLGIALASVFGSLTGTATSVASSIANNPVALIVGLILFALILVFSSFSTVLAGFYFEFLACFLHPLWRALIQPPLEVVALFFAAVLPVWNIARQLTASIGTETILDTLVCAGGQTLVVTASAAETMVLASTALVFWVQGSGNLSALDVSPDFFRTGRQLGRTISALDQFAECACEPLFDVAIRPFFSAFESDQFAQAANNTLAFTFVLLTQNLLKTVVRSAENANANSSAPIDQIIVRPSFNSTFEVLDKIFNNTGQVLDLQSGAAIQVALNIVGASIQSCPTAHGLANTRRCTASTTIDPALNGTCRAGQCQIPFLVQTGRGCCATPSVCIPNAPAASCNTSLPGTSFHPDTPCGALQRPGCGSCCFVDITTVGNLGFAAQCFQDFGDAECRVTQGGTRVLGTDCLKGTTSAPLITCEAVSRFIPGQFPEVETRRCGDCTGPDDSFCQCTTCACSYAADPLFDDLPRSIAANCTRESEPNVGEAVCIADFEFPLPPAPGAITGLMGLFLSTPLAQLPRYALNLLTNIELVFTTLDARRFWLIDDTLGIEVIESTQNIVATTFRWPAALLAAIGRFAADQPALQQPLSRSGAFSGLALSLSERRAVDRVLATEAEAIEIALGIIETLLNIGGDFIVQTVTAVVRTTELLINLSTGTVYGAVESFDSNGIPDPLFHAKRLFGGDSPGRAAFSCLVPLQPGYKPAERTRIVGILVDPGGTCTQLAEAREYCRFVFRQALGNSSLSSTEVLLPRPATVITTGAIDNIQTVVRNCNSQVPGCAPWVVQEVFIDTSPVAPNEYEIVVNQFLAIPRVLDAVFPAIGIPQLNKFFTNVTEPLAAASLILIDPVVHFFEMVSSIYIVCLDFEGLLDSLEHFVRAFTSAIRVVNDLIKSADDPVCNAARRGDDVRLFCAIAQAIDSAAGLVVEVVRIFWLVFTSAARLLDESRTFTNVANMFSLEVIEADLRDTIFSSLATAFSFVPDTVTCAAQLVAPVGCCWARVGFLSETGSFDPVCVERQTADSCPGHIRGSFPPGWVAQDLEISTVIFQGLPCSAIPTGAVPFPCASPVANIRVLNSTARAPVFVPLNTTRGCCVEFASVPSPNGERTEARSCIDNQAKFLCEQGSEEFLPSTACSADSRCPPRIDGNTAEVVLLDAASSVLTDAILLFARVPIGFIQELVRLINVAAQLPDNLLEGVVAAVITPILGVAADVFVQAGRVFECIGEGIFRDILEMLADFLDFAARTLVPIISDLLFTLLIFVVGIIQAFSGKFTLLGRAVTKLLLIFVSILLGILGQDFTCGLQGFVCDAVRVVDFLGADIEAISVDFASRECREIDCCLYQIEPKDGRTGACKDFPATSGIPNNCSFVNTTNTCDRFDIRLRKRGEVFGLSKRTPFDLFVREELARARGDKRKRQESSEPNDAFCGAFLAGYGVERARSNANATSDDAGVARSCLAVLERDPEDYESGVVWRGLQSLSRPYVNIGWRAVEEAKIHWSSQFAKARAAADAHLRAHVAKKNGREAANAILGRTSRKRSLGEPGKSDAPKSLVLEAMYLGALMQRTFGEQRLHEHAYNYFWSGVRKRSLPDIHPRAQLGELRTKGTAMRVLAWRAQETARSFTAGLAQPLRRFLAAAQWRAPSARDVFEGQQKRAELVAKINSLPHVPKYHHRFGSLQNGQIDLIVGNDTLEAIGLPTCAVSGEQAFCTDCVLFDNLVHAGTVAVRSVKEYYPNGQFGFVFLAKRFNDSIQNTLVDPIGTDTYTTTPKRVPWIGERFLTVRWFWQWDYSEFLSIVEGNSGPVDTDRFVGQTRLLQKEHALIVGRIDVDNNLLEVFGSALDPLITAGERVVGALQGLPSTQTVLALYERYIECDYEFALQCRSDLGIGLFDALANFALAYAIFGLVVGAIAPFGGLTAVTTAIPVMLIGYFAVLWMAYGTSPLCTLPSLFFGIMGVPACLPSDIALLFNEAFPQCPWVPISLIEPSALAEASQTFCATCGTIPPLVDCAPAAGFLNGFDNLFYTLTAVFGGEPNRVLAQVFSLALPPLAELAALYTPEYVAALGDLGAVCNRFTFLAIATTPVIISTLIGIAVAALALIALLAFAVLALYYAAWAAANEMLRQMDEGFVQGTRVEKLKQQ